jgi:membrane-associated phospholipid phosphatase
MNKIDHPLLRAHLMIATVGLFAGLFGVDRWLAESLQNPEGEGVRLFSQGTALLDLLSGKLVSKFLVGGMLLLAGCAFLAMKRARPRAAWWLAIGSVQLLSTLLAGMAKNLFGRLRPHELLLNGDWTREWFMAGGSFPSGHTAFYFGLFLPLACVLPRWRWVLLVIPWFIVVARVSVNDHFLSDTAASIILVALLTHLALVRLSRQTTGQPPPTASDESSSPPVRG